MVVNKRKKANRFRGSHTHGWGSKKKHRGSGNRGGFGMAGTGKRSDSNKPSITKDPYYFGKHGFKQKGPKKIVNAVNIDYIEGKLEEFLAEKLISKENNVYLVDLDKLGFNKLLGNGIVGNKLKIKTKYASSKAVEKVKQAGGEVILESKGDSSE